MKICILIPILVGLISAILGYLLGKASGNSNTGDLDAWKRKYGNLEADLAKCKAKVSNLESRTSMSASAAAPVAAASTVLAFNADAAKAVFGKKIKQDDLKIVEGIGPKIEELFHAADIKTWSALGAASVEKCQEVLLSGGDRFKMHVPATWPKQAEMAANGLWAELKQWQDELDGGK